MKHTNLRVRLAAGALALVMAVGIGVTPAMAAPNGGTTNTAVDTFAPADPAASDANKVVVEDAVPGATYNLYKLLQLEHRDEEYEYTPEGATESTTAKKIATYRYSYGDGLKDIVSEVVKLPAFQYTAEAGDNAAITHPGYGFKVDGENVVFITPATDTDGDYEEDAIVKAMMTAFADELRKRIDADTDLTPEQTAQAPAAAEGKTTSSVEFADVANGYWMITSNAGARAIIFTSPLEDDISQTVTVNEKNPAPTVDKKVFDKDDVAGTDAANGGSWKDANDAQIGDTLDFMITVELFNGSENIVVHDEMSKGLTFVGLDGIKFYPRKSATEYGREVNQAGGGTLTELELTTDVDGKKVPEADVAKFESTDRGFVLTFLNSFVNPEAGADNRDETNAGNNAFLGALDDLEDDGGKIEIRYKAMVNADAAIAEEKWLDCSEEHKHDDACYETGNTNRSYLQYGHIPGVDAGEEPGDTDPEPPHETPKDEVAKVYTYEFAIDKYVSGDTGTKLPGAEFQLRKNFVGIGTAAVEGKTNAYISGETPVLTLPAAEYTTDETVIKLKDETPTTEGYNGGKVYRVATPDEIAADAEKADDAKELTDTVVTDATGKITIRGLDSMLYSITETKAPAGYNQLDAPVMMAIGSAFSGYKGIVFLEDLAETAKRADENADYTFAKLTDTTVGIANASGIRMPRTGGIGTTIFYVAGGCMAMAALAVVVITVKKRRNED